MSNDINAIGRRIAVSATRALGGDRAFIFKEAEEVRDGYLCSFKYIDDIHAKDAYEGTWGCGTLVTDFTMSPIDAVGALIDFWNLHQ